MAEYSYDPSEVSDGSLNQMRFETGDIFVENDGVGAFMSDEEYLSVLGRNQSFKKAKLECFNMILARLSYQVTYSAGGMSVSLRERYENIKYLRDELKKELSSPCSASTAFFYQGDMAKIDGGHYFTLGMHDNYGNTARNK